MQEPEIPTLSESDLDPRDLITIADIAQLHGAPAYAALRSYAVYRREHKLLGEMPEAVAYAGGRRLWARQQIEAWLQPRAKLADNRVKALESIQEKAERRGKVRAWTRHDGAQKST